MAFDFDHDPLSESFETVKTIIHEESFVDELERRLIKWIGNIIIEVEDISFK